MDNSQKIEQIIQGMTKFNSETREILDSVKERMNEVLNQHYHVNENPIVLKTLEQEYEDIVATNESYQGVSAVGYRAILQNGDTVMVTGNSGHFFLNGERMTADYTYTGDGCEMVSVWVFEGVSWNIISPPRLYDTPTFTPYEIIIKNKNQTPEVNENYYLYTEKITTVSFDLVSQPKGCKVLIVKGSDRLTNQKCPLTLQELYSDCGLLTGWDFPINSHVKKISLPNCVEVSAQAANTPLKSSNGVTTWEWGKLVTIKGNSSPNYVIFSGTNTLLIPNTVKNISGVICQKNTNILLECNNANPIIGNWCYTEPINFSMAKDWGATVNLATAAKNWTPDKFVDLFENYLRDLTVMSGDGTIWAEQTITIPQAVYDQLTEEELSIAKNKGWTVGGA